MKQIELQMVGGRICNMFVVSFLVTRQGIGLAKKPVLDSRTTCVVIGGNLHDSTSMLLLSLVMVEI